MATAIRERHIRLAYAFLCGKEEKAVTFTQSELVVATGWKAGTAKTHLGKKLRGLVRSSKSGHSVVGVLRYTEEDFVRFMSQKDDVAREPKKAPLPPEVEALILKARGSALLALQVYNNPTTVFRTEGFVVLMVIAWTAILHAVLKKRGDPCVYTGDTGKPLIVDGDEKWFELKDCLRHYFGDANPPVRANLQFFIGLRNRIEHRFVPAIDPFVAAECQAMLFNFDELLVEHFGDFYALRESLAMPLQTANVRSDSSVMVLKKLQARNFEAVKGFIDDYRRELPDTTASDQRYAFRVYMLPRVANHAGSADMAIEFVKFDPKHAEDFEGIERSIVATREKQVGVAHPNRMSAKQAAKAVQERLGRPFTVHHNPLSWRRYKVRGSGYHPEKCDNQYCIADNVHQDYVYTSEWVDLLVQKLADQKEYDALLASTPKKAKQPGVVKVAPEV